GRFWRGSGVALFWDYLREKNFRRRDRDRLVPPRRMDAAVCCAEVCYPFGREHGRHRAVRRREFITLLGGAAAWPLAARAEHQEGVRRIAVLIGVAGDSETKGWVSVFRKRLDELGWRVGGNLQIEERWTAGDPDPKSALCQRTASYEAGCSFCFQFGGSRSSATGKPHGANCFHRHIRSGGKRVCGEPCTARAKCHWLHQFRSDDGSEVA